MGQQFGQRVLVDETGDVEEEIDVRNGEFLSLEIVTISGDVEITAGLIGLNPIGIVNALTEVVEPSASAAGLWWAFVAPYTKVVVSVTGLGASDEVWVGVQ